MTQDKGASLRDRAVVNGARQAVSALRASVPSAYSVSPICARMMDAEDENGGVAIRPGAWRNYLRPRDWLGWPVIAEYGDEVHIIAVLSARSGAFRDMVRDIRIIGKTPVVVCPIGPTMPAILHKWGWQETITGEGWDRREEWRPAQAMSARQSQDPQGLGPQDASAVPAGDAPNPDSHPQEKGGR